MFRTNSVGMQAGCDDKQPRRSFNFCWIRGDATAHTTSTVGFLVGILLVKSGIPRSVSILRDSKMQQLPLPFIYKLLVCTTMSHLWPLSNLALLLDWLNQSRPSTNRTCHPSNVFLRPLYMYENEFGGDASEAKTQKTQSAAISCRNYFGLTDFWYRYLLTT